MISFLFKRKYCKEGGFPQVVLADVATEKIQILQSYFNTMLFRDMIEHSIDHDGLSINVVPVWK